MNKANFAMRLITLGLTLPFTIIQKADKLCKRNITIRKTFRIKRRILRDEVKSCDNQSIIERAKINVLVHYNFCYETLW